VAISGAMVSMPARARWSVAQSRMLVGLTAVIALGFAVGVPFVPHSPVELVVFDVVLFNAAPLLAALLCLRAARRVPEERMVWWGAATALVLNVAGALVYALAVAPLAEEPFPSVADVFWLAAYPAFVVITLAMLRSRVTRPQASTWLDGLVGALGVTAVAATVFITPAVTSPHLDALATAANLATRSRTSCSWHCSVRSWRCWAPASTASSRCSASSSRPSSSATCCWRLPRQGTDTSPGDRSTSRGWRTPS
jgi:hypothetical protein